ncbi:MAG: hypothetical protein JNM76_01240 [Betaproteobacteria bacterium]|nr:hypothetical protein [Betaproteobacteria bacterium]
MLTVPKDANQHIQLGLAASQADDSASALAHFQRAASAAPESGIPHFLIGSELAAAQRYAEAESAFASAVVLSPEFPLARYQLGLLQFTSGRIPMAMMTWEPLLQLAQGPLPHFVQGFAAMATDNFSKAVSLFQEGISRNHDNPALSRDIEMVIAEIQSKTDSASAAGERMNGAAETDARSEAHVLLANYQQSGLPH